MAKRTGATTTYHVVVQGFKLSKDAEKRLETEIRRVVMQELAASDFQGDLQISPITKFPDLFDPAKARIGGGHTAGIWVQEQ